MKLGDHLLSGAVLEPRALNELFPDWKNMNSPVKTEVTEDHIYGLLGDSIAVPLPVIDWQKNHGNYIISLGVFSRWLAEKAEELGVEIYSGYPGSELLYDEEGRVKGVATGDVGIGKDGKPTNHFERGFEFHAPITILAEGCRGSLSKQAIKKYGLHKEGQFQTYGLGVKEVWEVDPSKFHKGRVVHTVGWPIDINTYGGSFMYHWEDNKVALGMVVGLDYSNPYLSPYKEFQRWKHHKFISDVLKGGRCIAYGARALTEGGYQSIPELVFPGGALIGCSAGLLNVPKIKGNHTAMKSGMLAGEAVFNQLSKSKEYGQTLVEYPDSLKKSWVWEELYKARNIRPSFHKVGGNIGGFLYSGLDWLLFKGREPWTFQHNKPDNESTKKISEVTPIEYPKPDGVLSFDLLTNLQRSGTNHNEDQPPHLKVMNKDIPTELNLKEYGGPESRYCPAGVYEFVDKPEGGKRLQINAQNCLHCKTCDIKDPTQNINFTTPEGGGGPAYATM